jgi:hypothetical protein
MVTKHNLVRIYDPKWFSTNSTNGSVITMLGTHPTLLTHLTVSKSAPAQFPRKFSLEPMALGSVGVARPDRHLQEPLSDGSTMQSNIVTSMRRNF